jgi:C-terminal processing protease CtpA/Prc
LRQTVSNINPANDLYKNLGLQKGASTTAINLAYKQKTAELSKATSTEAKAELAQATYAHQVLSNQNNKQIYDQSQVEPTVFSHIFGSTLYLYIDKISPNTLGEFARTVDSASTTANLSSMILDLRGNIGGDLTFPQYFLGLFLGQNQYAFDLFHQGDYQVQRTVVPTFPELSRYKEYAVLTDSMTQSTAELLTATLKRFKIAYSVGTKTRGWGSVENTYPINTVIDPKEKYALLLVNSLTLRDDNQPIEMNGVLPNVDTGTANWKAELPNYFNSANLVKVLSQRAIVPPMN